MSDAADTVPLHLNDDNSEPVNDVNSFQPLRSIKVALFQLFLSTGLGVFGAFLHVYHNSVIKPCDFIMALLLFQVTFWVLNVIIDHYYKWRHESLKLCGHFRFYEKINRRSNLILANVSLFNVLFILLFAVMLMGKSEYPNLCQNRGKDSAYFLLGLMIMIESLVSIILIIRYIIRVRKFNKKRSMSDIDEFEHRLFFPEDYGVGYRNPGESSADLVRKCVHLLFYYKAATNELKERVLLCHFQHRNR